MQVKRLFQYKNKVFLTWIATNILIFLIPVVTGEYVYFNSIAVVKNEVENVHQASLQQIKILVDGKIEELRKIGSSLAIDSNVKTLAYSQYLYSPKNLYSMAELQNDLKKYIISNSFIESIYLYFNSSQCLLTDNDIYSSEELEDYVNKDFTTSLGDWRNQIQEVNQGSIRIFKNNDDTGAKGTVALFQSISANIHSKSPEATLIVIVNSEKLKALLSSLDTASKANISILDNRNEYWQLTGDYILPESISYDGLRSADSIFSIERQDYSATIIHTGSGINNLHYILSMPSSVFAYKIRYIKTIIYFYTGACLILGLIVIYTLTRRNYYPLMRLTQMSSNNASIYKKWGIDEYNVIENAIKGLINYKENAEKILKHQDAALRKSFLARVLKGRIKNSLRTENLKKLYKIQFQGGDFVVMAFEVESIGDIFAEKGKETEDESLELVYFIIQNITEELVGTNYPVYFTETDGMCVCLINCKTSLSCSKELETMHNDIAEAAENAIDFIKKYFGISLSAAVSSIKQGLDGIPSAYAETLEILEYRRLMEKSGAVIKYGSIEQSKSDELDNINTMKSEIQFMNYLLDNDFKNAGLILDSIMEYYLPSDATNFQIVKCRMFGLINIMLNAVGEFKSKADIDYFNKLDPMNRMINSKSGTELKKQIRVIFKSMIEYSNANESGEAQNKISDIINYVNHHYFDPDLNVSSIALQYEMNASYLCRIFKKSTGTSILDYIHSCRIKNAKSMLSTGLNIAEISAKVGYSSSLAMIRIFKKFEGVTPGKYRERLLVKE